MKYGLLGEKLSHSFSPQIHKALGNADYALCPVAKEDFDAFMRARDFCGLNVTIPYKQAVIPYLDGISRAAEAIGSVNTIVKSADGRLYGDNTDYAGFAALAKRAGISFAGKKVLVLGSGGTSLTARAVARDAGAKEIVVISRGGADNYENIGRHADAEVIINTTPVGMYPNNGTAAVSLAGFPKLGGVVDVIYNPQETALMRDAERRKIPHASGLYMLVAQAKYAEDIFFGTQGDASEIDRIYGALRAEVSNVVLVGMPGSGKSEVGKALAEQLGKRFADTDAYVEEQCGMTIPEIFAAHGEAYFRAAEHRAAEALGKESGMVIATGGGIVLREDNVDALRQNGSIVYIERDLSLLATEGRPLSKDPETLRRMYEARLPLYRKSSSLCVENNSTVAACAAAIREALQ